MIQESDTACGFREPDEHEIVEAVQAEVDAFARNPGRSTVGERLLEESSDDLLWAVAGFFKARRDEYTASEALAELVEQEAARIVRHYSTMDWAVRRGGK